jgi:hypothetical protein
VAEAVDEGPYAREVENMPVMLAEPDHGGYSINEFRPRANRAKITGMVMRLGR